MPVQNHQDHRLAPSLLRSPRDGWFEQCREPRSTSSGVPRQGPSPASSCIETASPRKRRSKGLSCVRGNSHAQFLEGWTGAIPSGYSVTDRPPQIRTSASTHTALTKDEWRRSVHRDRGAERGEE